MIGLAMSRIQDLFDIGGPVVMILAAMSVLSLAIVIWKALVFEFEGVGRASRRGFVAVAIADAHLARRRGVFVGDLRERMIARLDREFGRAASGLRVLDLISQIAPLLGLFGTVLGMIAAFQTLQTAGSSADPSVLAGGIWVALLTTAAGLVVAMPTSVLLAWLDARLEDHRRYAEDALEDALTPSVFSDVPSAHTLDAAHA